MLIFKSLLLAALFATTNRASAANVSLPGGATLIGQDLPTLHQEFYGGIPFAQPPVGQLRLKPPVLSLSPSGPTFNATRYGPACIQNAADLSTISEDCLTINVLKPVGVQPGDNIPVMAWIYGGSFNSGSGSLYNGSAIVAQSVVRGTPVIYVNFNYRLGPLGFPQGIEAAQQGIANLGLKDQLAALQWIQANIHAFGGDKSKVTVFGQSAGAISIAIHWLQPNFTSFARAVILESGSAATNVVEIVQARDADWGKFVNLVPECAHSANASTVNCLRNATLSTAELLNATLGADALAGEGSPFSPVLDGPGGVFPLLPSLSLEAGITSKLPFMSGTVLDEGTDFVPVTFYPRNNNTVLEDYLFGTYNLSFINFIGNLVLEEDIGTVLTLYPDIPALGSPYGTGDATFDLGSFKRVASLLGDLNFQSQRRFMSQAAALLGIGHYSYHFIDPQPGNTPYLGVSHASEIRYVYGEVPATFPSASLSLSANIIDYWVSFAVALDPNDGKGTQRTNWTQYTPSNFEVLQLNGTNTTMIPDTFREEQIGFFEANALVFHA